MSSYNVGNAVRWAFGPCVIDSITPDGHFIIKGSFNLWAKVSKEMLDSYQSKTDVPLMFKCKPPSFLIVDNFYDHPDEVRKLALVQDYATNIKFYKGKRTAARFLFPGLKEQFERLLGVPIKNWLNYGTNGIFQITNFTDPLVWHHDTQSYAAAIYLTPDAPVGAGTSFWRDTKYGCRKDPRVPEERCRFNSDEEVEQAYGEIFSEYNLLHQDNWELVDKVGSVYNRLAMWNSKIIHSASSYDAFKDIANHEAAGSRLIQLFFFDI